MESIIGCTFLRRWASDPLISYPICSMYGIFTYISHKYMPNVDEYSIHGASGYGISGVVIPINWPYTSVTGAMTLLIMVISSHVSLVYGSTL